MGGIILLIIFFILIAIRVPVSFAMGVATLIAMIFSDFSDSIYQQALLPELQDQYQSLPS